MRRGFGERHRPRWCSWTLLQAALAFLEPLGMAVMSHRPTTMRTLKQLSSSETQGGSDWSES